MENGGSKDTKDSKQHERKPNRKKSRTGSQTPTSEGTVEDDNGTVDDGGEEQVTPKKTPSQEQVESKQKDRIPTVEDEDDPRKTPKDKLKKKRKKKSNNSTVSVDVTKDEEESDDFRKSAASMTSQTSVCSPLRSGERIQFPPTRFSLYVVNVPTLATKTWELVLSINFVVRKICRTNQAFNLLAIGDQIVYINDNLPKSVPDFEYFVRMADTNTIKLTVIRAFNLHPPPEDRIRHIKKIPVDTAYFAVDLLRGSATKTGLQLGRFEKKIKVIEVPPDSRAAHTFYKGDRIHDIDGRPVSRFPTVETIKKFVGKTLNKYGKCSFLVERYMENHSTPNPSAFAERVRDPLMAYDVMEIGAREAFKHMELKNKYAGKLTSSLKPEKQAEDGTVDDTEANAEEMKRRQKAALVKRKTYRARTKKSKTILRNVAIDKKNDYFTIPSDVPDKYCLSPVTSKSGLIFWMKNIMNK